MAVGVEVAVFGVVGGGYAAFRRVQDAAINDEVGDVNALGRKFAGKGRCQAAQRNLPIAKMDELG